MPRSRDPKESGQRESETAIPEEGKMTTLSGINPQTVQSVSSCIVYKHEESNKTRVEDR